MQNKNDKHAVVLSGGGGFGAFEVGVLRALATGRSPATDGEPLEAEIFIGTSVGAYNAAVMASRSDPDTKAAVAHLEDLWLNRIAGSLADNGVLRIRGNPAVLFDPLQLFRDDWRVLKEASADLSYLSIDAGRRLKHFVSSKDTLVHRAMEMFDIGTLISTEPLEKLLRETTSLADLRKSSRMLKIAATNWKTGELRVFVHDPDRKEHVWQQEEEEGVTEDTWPLAVMASTAIPGIFPVVHIGGNPHVDGGVVANTPMRPAIKAGANVIHVICMDADARNTPLAGGPPNTMDTFERFLNLAVAATVEGDIETARFINKVLAAAPPKDDGGSYRAITVHRYHPEIDLGGLPGMLDFRRERIQSRIEAGALAAYEHDCELEGCVIPSKPHIKRVPRHQRSASKKHHAMAGEAK